MAPIHCRGSTGEQVTAKYLQASYDKETNSSTSSMAEGWVNVYQIKQICVNYSFNNKLLCDMIKFECAIIFSTITSKPGYVILKVAEV